MSTLNSPTLNFRIVSYLQQIGFTQVSNTGSDQDHRKSNHSKDNTHDFSSVGHISILQRFRVDISS